MSNIIVMNKKYSDTYALHNVLLYCYRKCVGYWYGYGVRMVDIFSVMDSMEYIKRYHNKMEGKQVCHIVINANSIYDTGEKYTMQQAIKDGAELDKIAYVISYLIYKEGYQNCFFRHMSKKNIPHLHYVINPVHVETGKKLSNYTELARGILTYLNQNYPQLRWEGVRFNNGNKDEDDAEW